MPEDTNLIGSTLNAFFDSGSSSTGTTSKSTPSKEEIANLPLLEVNTLREKYKDNEDIQAALGSREHFLFMEDAIRQAPWAAPGAVGMTLGYQAVKATDVGRELVKTTEQKASPASIEQLKGGLGGIASGLGLSVGDTLLGWMGVEIIDKGNK